MIKQLHKVFALKDLGKLHYFLGVQVSYTRDGGLFLCQTKYLIDLLLKDKMANAKACPTPMVSNLKLTKGEGQSFKHTQLYRSLAGAL